MPVGYALLAVGYAALLLLVLAILYAHGER